MRMTTEIKETVNIVLSDFELECFERVESVLSTIQRCYEDRNVNSLTSLTTGEVIAIEEIARVRGILSGLTESVVFEIE